MKGVSGILALLVLGMIMLAPAQVLAADATQEAILKKLEELQKRVTYLENKLSEAQQTAKDAQQAAAKAYATSGHSLKVSPGDRQDQGRAAPGPAFRGGQTSEGLRRGGAGRLLQQLRAQRGRGRQREQLHLGHGRALL